MEYFHFAYGPLCKFYGTRGEYLNPTKPNRTYFCTRRNLVEISESWTRPVKNSPCFGFLFFYPLDQYNFIYVYMIQLVERQPKVNLFIMIVWVNIWIELFFKKFVDLRPNLLTPLVQGSKYSPLLVTIFVILFYTVIRVIFVNLVLFVTFFISCYYKWMNCFYKFILCIYTLFL